MSVHLWYNDVNVLNEGVMQTHAKENTCMRMKEMMEKTIEAGGEGA
jgi:hypothetical protein